MEAQHLHSFTLHSVDGQEFEAFWHPHCPYVHPAEQLPTFLDRRRVDFEGEKIDPRWAGFRVELSGWSVLPSSDWRRFPAFGLVDPAGSVVDLILLERQLLFYQDLPAYWERRWSQDGSALPTPSGDWSGLSVEDAGLLQKGQLLLLQGIGPRGRVREPPLDPEVVRAVAWGLADQKGVFPTQLEVAGEFFLTDRQLRNKLPTGAWREIKAKRPS